MSKELSKINHVTQYAPTLRNMCKKAANGDDGLYHELMAISIYTVVDETKGKEFKAIDTKVLDKIKLYLATYMMRTQNPRVQ